jgi:hypothetical protein
MRWYGCAFRAKAALNAAHGKPSRGPLPRPSPPLTVLDESGVWVISRARPCPIAGGHWNVLFGARDAWKRNAFVVVGHALLESIAPAAMTGKCLTLIADSTGLDAADAQAAQNSMQSTLRQLTPLPAQGIRLGAAANAHTPRVLRQPGGFSPGALSRLDAAGHRHQLAASGNSSPPATRPAPAQFIRQPDVRQHEQPVHPHAHATH